MVTAICSDRQWRKGTYGFARLGPQLDWPGISLWDIFPSPPSQLAVESRTCPKRHLPVENPLFHLYKNPVLHWQISRLWLYREISGYQNLRSCLSGMHLPSRTHR